MQAFTGSPYLYYIHVHLDLVVATRKAFDVKNMYKSLFHRKCTVAAAHNLSVHVFSSIGNIWKNLHISRLLVYRPIEGHFDLSFLGFEWLRVDI